MNDSRLVGFIGAPGSGKTTLACAMKEHSLVNGAMSDICTEYAREFSYKYGITNNVYAQYRITFEQAQRETLLLQGSSEYIFSDSPIWLGYLYGLLHSVRYPSQEELDVVADLYQKFVMSHVQRYKVVFHLINDFPQDDGCRDMEINKHISNVVEGFVCAHEHLLPIKRVTVSAQDIEGRKEFVWNELKSIKEAEESEKCLD